MHDCPACGLACDCDGEDTFMDSAAEDCVHPQTAECLVEPAPDEDFDDQDDA